MFDVGSFMIRFLSTMDLEFIVQGNLKVYMNLGKAIAYFVQLAEMMAPGRAGGEVAKGEGQGRKGLANTLFYFSRGSFMDFRYNKL